MSYLDTSNRKMDYSLELVALSLFSIVSGFGLLYFCVRGHIKEDSFKNNYPKKERIEQKIKIEDSNKNKGRMTIDNIASID